MDFSDESTLRNIMVVGGIVMFAGVLLEWCTYKDPVHTEVMSGFNVFTGGENPLFEGVKYLYIPAIAMICGVVAVAMKLIDDDFSDILEIIAVILSFIAVVGCIMWYFQMIPGPSSPARLYEVFQVGLGFLVTLLGSLICFISGAVCIVRTKIQY